MIEYLCFSGGGVRACGYAKVPLALQELGYLADIKGVIGTSAGAIMAALIACRIPVDEIAHIIEIMKFASFQDGSRWKIVDLIGIWRKFGYNPGDTFSKWFREILQDYLKDPEITLSGLYEKTGIDLVTVTTCLEENRAVYLNHQTFPDLPVYLAVRMSMSIPVFFEPVKYPINGRISTFVDGGVTNNYPFNYWKENVLGFKLISDDEQIVDQQTLPVTEQIGNILSFLEAIIDTMMYTIENTEVSPGYWQDSILIKTGNLKSIDFNPDPKEVTKVIQGAYEAVYSYFKRLTIL
jgi:NTE family protein